MHLINNFYNTINEKPGDKKFYNEVLKFTPKGWAGL